MSVCMLTTLAEVSFSITSSSSGRPCSINCWHSFLIRAIPSLSTARCFSSTEKHSLENSDYHIAKYISFCFSRSPSHVVFSPLDSFRYFIFQLSFCTYSHNTHLPISTSVKTRYIIYNRSATRQPVKTQRWRMIFNMKASSYLRAL